VLAEDVDAASDLTPDLTPKYPLLSHPRRGRVDIGLRLIPSALTPTSDHSSGSWTKCGPEVIAPDS
jgi:hypothetical protein